MVRCPSLLALADAPRPSDVVSVGPIIRISPNEVHVSDPAFFETLYDHNGCWDKYDWAYDAFSTYGSLNCTVGHDLHKARRRPLNPFFSKASVHNRRSIILRSLTRFCDRIAQPPPASSEGKKQPVPLGTALSALARDISYEFILNKEHASLKMEDYGITLSQFSAGGGVVWRTTKFIPFFGPTLKMIPPSLMLKIGDEGTKTLFHFIRSGEAHTKELLEDATATDADQAEKPSTSNRTIVHDIVDSKLPPQEKTLQRISDEVTVVAGSGFETTASVLRLVFFHVFTNQDILARLRAELMALQSSDVGTGDTPELKALEQLPYLTSVIKEGMRLSPAIGSRMARVARDRDLFYKNVRIPAGTPVGMTTLLMHLDEELYPFPYSFKPERWMDPNDSRRLDKVYAPFSKGTRNCLGMHLAWAEMYLIIARIVQQFNFEFPGAKAEDFEMASDRFIIFTKGEAVLNAFVTPRNI
jgi:cytochrome P450